MITYVKGSLFESPAKVLVNTVNTVGVMGKGIAKTFKEIYPVMFAEYQTICEKGLFQPGKLWLYKTPHKWILNFPTKEHWRNPSKLEYIEEGLKKFVSSYPSQGITSIAFPQLGCGNGELDWETLVQPLMSKYLNNLPIDIFIYLYGKGFAIPEHKDVEAMNVWLRGEPRTLPFDEIWEDLTKVIGSGRELTTWDDAAPFRIVLANQGENGLLIQKIPNTFMEKVKIVLSKLVPPKLRIINNKEIFVPEDAMLDLWQSVRLYGFCLPRIMPEGLDIIARYLFPLFEHLDYMKPVEVSTSREQQQGKSERALFLFPLRANNVDKTISSPYAVQPA